MRRREIVDLILLLLALFVLLKEAGAGSLGEKIASNDGVSELDILLEMKENGLLPAATFSSY